MNAGTFPGAARSVADVPVGGVTLIGSDAPLLKLQGRSFLRSGVYGVANAYPKVPADLTFKGIANQVVRTPGTQSFPHGRMIWGGSLFVGMANATGANSVFTSPDGITWTPRAVTVNGTSAGVSYLGSIPLYLTLDGNSAIHTSPDGATWTSRTSPTGITTPAFNVAGNGAFVIGGTDPSSGGIVQSSPNAATTAFTTRTLANSAGKPMNAAIYAGGQFVVVGNNNGIWTSADGTTWTQRSLPAPLALTGIHLNNVTYGGGLYVVTCTNATGLVFTSPDGITWTARSLSATNAPTTGAAAYVDGVFILPCGGLSYHASKDGVTWYLRSAAAVAGGTDAIACLASNGSGVNVVAGTNSTVGQLLQTFEVRDLVALPTFSSGLYMRVD